mgnify:CR=1 FL=1
MPNVVNFHLPEAQESEAAIKNSGLQKADRDLIYSLGLTTDASPLTEPRITNNRLTLSAGSFAGTTLTKHNTIIKGATGASLMDGQLQIMEDAVLDGVEFVSSKNNTGYLVSVKAGSTAVFRNCIFSKETDTITNGTAIWVSLASRAIVIGCVFRGGNGVDVPILNGSGSAAAVQVVGTYNKTGVAFGATVTLTAVIE